MHKTSQTTWILIIQHSHNQSVLVLEELLSTLKKKAKDHVQETTAQEEISNQLLDQLWPTKSAHQFITLLWKEEMQPQIEEMLQVIHIQLELV